jgi:hypothetical protein
MGGSLFVPEWSRAKAANVGFWTGRGWSAGEISRELADGTSPSALRAQWRRWKLPMEKRDKHKPATAVVNLTYPARARLAQLAKARKMAPEEWLSLVALAAIRDDLFDAVVDDEGTQSPVTPAQEETA